MARPQQVFHDRHQFSSFDLATSLAGAKNLADMAELQSVFGASSSTC
jgi:hypothetical protein